MIVMICSRVHSILNNNVVCGFARRVPMRGGKEFLYQNGNGN